MILFTTITLEIAVDTGLDAKTQHLLRRRFEEVTEEAINGALSELDIENQFAHAVSVDEIEVRDE
jgi:hypothetical protein